MIGVVYGIKYGYREVWEEWMQRRGWGKEERDNPDFMKRSWGRARKRGEGGEGSQGEGNELLEGFIWMTDKIETQRKFE